MSTLSNAFAALKNVILMQDRIDRIQQGLDATAADFLGLRDYAFEIDKRVARIEGVMEGYQRASGSARKKLPPE